MVSSTIFWVFGMTCPGTEPRYPGLLAKTITALSKYIHIFLNTNILQTIILSRVLNTNPGKKYGIFELIVYISSRLCRGKFNGIIQYWRKIVSTDNSVVSAIFFFSVWYTKLLVKICTNYRPICISRLLLVFGLQITKSFHYFFFWNA